MIISTFHQHLSKLFSHRLSVNRIATTSITTATCIIALLSKMTCLRPKRTRLPGFETHSSLDYDDGAACNVLRLHPPSTLLLDDQQSY